jgi:hypothetical protein
VEKVFPNGYIDLKKKLPTSSAVYQLMTIGKENMALISKVENTITMKSAIDSKYTLAQYNSVHAQALNLKTEIRLALLKAIDYMLAFYSDSVHKMNVSQAMMLINTLLVDFYYFKLEEVILILKNGKIGRYGKIYNRVDADIVYSWFVEYSKERDIYVENMREQERIHHKSESLKVSLTEQQIMEEYTKAKTKRLNE